MTQLRRIPLLLSLLAALAALLAAGCGKAPRVAEGRLDTPEHHTIRGLDFIEEGNWAEAARSFDLALSLGKDFGPAYAGKAIVVAHEADPKTMPEGKREPIYNKASDLLEQARKNAKGDDQERAYRVAAIRVHRLTQFPRDFVANAEGHFDKAVKLDPRGQDPDPYFYMAQAYRDAFQLNKAQEMYRKVLGMNTSKTGKADEELSLVQKILRAEPGSRVGKVIAFDDTITRADIAALFVEELRLGRLYLRGNTSQFDTAFKPPAGQQQFQADTLVKAPEASDIDNHPLRADILEVLKLRVTGLQPDPAHQFHPNATVLRGEFAMMVEDILVKVTGEQGIKTKFIGQPSPFRDVRSDVPWFNAIQVVSTRSLMEPKDKVNGIFKPGDPIAGADALLVLRLLKDELRSYIRS